MGTRMSASIYRSPGHEGSVTIQVVYRWITATSNGWQERVVVDARYDGAGQARDADAVVYGALLAALVSLETEIDARP